jgi:hypothetical protein
MNDKVYMLLDILEGKSTPALKVLQTLKGVVADALEGHPNTMVIVEAPDRQQLAERVMPVLDLLDSITQDIHLLMKREDALVPSFQATVAQEPTSVN